MSLCSFFSYINYQSSVQKNKPCLFTRFFSPLWDSFGRHAVNQPADPLYLYNSRVVIMTSNTEKENTSDNLPAVM